MQNGGTLNSSGGSIGQSSGSNGSVTVSGPGSTWNNGPLGGLIVGSFGTGTLTITNGATVLNNTTPAARIGNGTQSQGTVLVTGAGSLWSNSTTLTIGLNGAGSLTLAQGGRVSAPGVTIAQNAGSTGVLNIGAAKGTPATLAGTLATPSVTFGTGTGRLVFNHTAQSGNAYKFIPRIAGEGRVVVLSGATHLIANNTYTGGTLIAGGMVLIDSNPNLGDAAGTLTIDGGTLRTRDNILMARNTTLGAGSGTLDTQGNTLIMNAPITGDGALTKLGAGTLVLTADNTYSGGTNIAAGIVQLGNGGTTGAILGDVIHNGNTLIFKRSNELVLAGNIRGTGSLLQEGSGTTVLRGNSVYFSGSTAVTNGTLRINGVLGNGTNAMTVSDGGRLGGTGTFDGDVSIGDGGVLAPGNSPGTLFITGNLSLAGTSTLDYEFGRAGVPGGRFNDLTLVGGNLTLDGTLNLNASVGGTFGPGLYRLISYDGTLTDNGLALGTQPAGSVNSVQTSVARQVNLLNTAGLTLDFWDGGDTPRHNGQIEGGPGVWQGAGGNDNWTDSTGVVNASYAPGSFAVFSGTPGTVTIDHSLGAVVPAGMQFASSGYVLQGQSVTLAPGTNILRVGDGSAPGVDYVATIDSKLTGAGSINKTDLGTLVLTGNNRYSGGTTISGGIVQIANDANLGALSGALTFDGGTLRTTGGFTTARATTLLPEGGTIETQSGVLTLNGTLDGAGALTKTGTGTLILSDDNSYTGSTTVATGTLRASAARSFSAASNHTVAAGATLDTDGFNQQVSALTNSGTASLISATGGSTLTVANGAYVGNAGILRLGTGSSGSDRLVLDGSTASASGTTRIQIATLGGLGAQTTGNGIEVISARNGATTTAQTTKGAFSLAGGHVDAGAFEYRLHAADAQGLGENWYLRSTTDVTPPGIPPTQEANYRSEVPLLAALPGQLRQADLAMLGNLHRRMGDEASDSSSESAKQAPASLAEAGKRRAWGRFVYSDMELEQPGVAQARTNLRVSGLQAGTDLLAMNAWRAGTYVGYLDGNADVSGNARGVTADVGSNDLRSLYLGAYWTWMEASGWYVDGVLQGASHRYKIRPDGNPDVSGDASGFMASVEGGKAFALIEGWSIEPQAQLAWQRNSFDDLTLGGAHEQQDSSSGWIGRLGVRIMGDLATPAGRLQPYGRLNYYHANYGGDAARFIGPAASTVITSDNRYSAGEVAGGATLMLTPAVSLYGEIGTLWSIGGDASVESSLQGSLGIKLRW